jgi:hypothetical protein
VAAGLAQLLREEARERDFGEAGTTGQDSGTTMDVDGQCLGVAGVDARPTLDPVRGNTCVGYTSVTSSMPSSTYMTSCIVNWWYSTISRRNLFSRAYTEFSCASRAFSANSDSNWRRICKSNECMVNHSSRSDLEPCPLS